MSEITKLYKLYLISSLIISVCTIPLNLRNIDTTADKNFINDEDESDLFDFTGETKHKFEEYLTRMLELYYDEVIAPNLTQSENNIDWKKYEMKNGSWDYGKYFDEQEKKEKMQSDIPSSNSGANINNGSESSKNLIAISNKNATNSFLNAARNYTSAYEQTRQKNLEAALAESDKKQWLEFIQRTILKEIGRDNTTISSSIRNPVMNLLNRTGSVQMQPKLPESETENEEYISKKIRSFYPSCDVPRNTDEEIWKETNSMNLLFNVEYTSQTVNTGETESQTQDDNVNIASATLRLYRLPQENNATITENCKNGANNAISDDDKQIRVSIYWYLRVLKKHKVVKRKLADSRMVPMYEPRIPGSNPINPSSHYVEFNIRPAAKTWVRGRNWGLTVVVEDMDGTILNAGRYFKGVACDMVGNVSTPIPIPTAFFDANPDAFGLGHSSNGTKSIASIYDRLLPQLDICTVEFTPGFNGPKNVDNSKFICRILKSTGADIKKTHHDTKIQTGKSEGRHIRHQHQQHHLGETDFRDNFVSKTLVLTNSQLQQLNLQNISNVNR